MLQQPFKIDGPRAYGEQLVLANQHDNLVAQVSWRDVGYTVVPFLGDSQFSLLKQGLKKLFVKALAKEGIAVPESFSIDQYHQLVNGNQELHLKVLEHTKAIDYAHFPIYPETMTARITEELQLPLTTRNPNTGENIFHLRVVRPHVSDFNPLHRDAWLDELKGSINLYVPLAGSTERSALVVVPGSHYWPESDVERTLAGAVMNGAKYNVPGLTDTKKQLNQVRPNPSENEVLIFSPYLIHGGATNENPDTTRVSLEVRLWRG
ncbi:phytanoyl-CoA dioxygenase family protein [Pontibacter sp. H249]|uniref:phytanoyl-CoA dioxygenase family protein n=1 Tax=Pontibacter sp. H249 TaxID=3133420 RepID=UPI0030BE757F